MLFNSAGEVNFLGAGPYASHAASLFNSYSGNECTSDLNQIYIPEFKDQPPSPFAVTNLLNERKLNSGSH